jgi:hypothetical protein
MISVECQVKHCITFFTAASRKVVFTIIVFNLSVANYKKEFTNLKHIFCKKST